MKKVFFLDHQHGACSELRERFDKSFETNLSNSHEASYIEDTLRLTPSDLLVYFPDEDDGNLFRSVIDHLQKKYPQLPVFIVFEEKADMSRHTGLAGNIWHVFSTPFDVNALYQDACNLLDKLSVSSESVAAGGINNGRRNILVVDDSPTTLRTIKAMLEEKYNVTCVPSGIKAIAQLEKRRPDLILLDYAMPVMDGKETLRLIRAEEDYAGIPVVFLTSLADKEHVTSVLSLKPNGYLLKPPDAQQLIDVIEKVLQG